MKKRVAVFFGGKSVEHDISIITFSSCLRFLSSEYDIYGVYIDKYGLFYHADNLDDLKIYTNFEKLAKNKREITIISGKPYIAEKRGNKYNKFYCIDCALLCNHGYGGEDGCLQGLLKISQIPFSSPDVMPSAICMDKVFTKDILCKHNIPTTNYQSVKSYDEDKIKQKSKVLNFPLICKPARLGSSIGVSICQNDTDLMNGIKLALKFDSKVIFEEMVTNLSEFACACFRYNGELYVSSVEALKFNKNIYSFDEKYLSKEKGSKLKINKKLENEITKLTQRCYEIFDFDGMVRVDFLYDNDVNKLYVSEINTIPGSMALHLFKNLNKTEILDCILNESNYIYQENLKKTYSFDSNAISIYENFLQNNKNINKT